MPRLGKSSGIERDDKLEHLKILAEYRSMLPLGKDCTYLDRMDQGGSKGHNVLWKEIKSRVTAAGLVCKAAGPHDPILEFKTQNWCRWKFATDVSNHIWYKIIEISNNPFLHSKSTKR